MVYQNYQYLNISFVALHPSGWGVVGLLPKEKEKKKKTEKKRKTERKKGTIYE